MYFLIVSHLIFRFLFPSRDTEHFICCEHTACRCHKSYWEIAEDLSRNGWVGSFEYRCHFERFADFSGSARWIRSLVYWFRTRIFACCGVHELLRMEFRLVMYFWMLWGILRIACSCQVVVWVVGWSLARMKPFAAGARAHPMVSNDNLTRKTISRTTMIWTIQVNCHLTMPSFFVISTATAVRGSP